MCAFILGIISFCYSLWLFPWDPINCKANTQSNTTASTVLQWWTRVEGFLQCAFPPSLSICVRRISLSIIPKNLGRHFPCTFIPHYFFRCFLSSPDWNLKGSPKGHSLSWQISFHVRVRSSVCSGHFLFSWSNSGLFPRRWIIHSENSAKKNKTNNSKNSWQDRLCFCSSQSQNATQ